MLSGSVKLVAAAASVMGPLVAGLVFPHALVLEAQIFVIVAGMGAGLAGLFGFAAIDRHEEARHRAILRTMRRA